MSAGCSNKNSIHCQQCDGRARNDIFATLPPEALALIDENKSIHAYKRGQYIFYSGNPPSGLYCINAGTVKLENESRGGTSHVYRVVTVGGVLGYRALFANEEYHSSALVHEDAVVCHIPKSCILELVSRFPEVGFGFLAYISRELRSAEDRHRSLADKEAPRRVAETILQLKKNFPEMTWTRKDIAEWADTTPETVMRSLSDFKSKGFIELRGRKIDIKNFDAFLDYADPPE